MKKRILSLVLCAAMLLSMCLFLGAGVTEDTSDTPAESTAAAQVQAPQTVVYTAAGPFLPAVSVQPVLRAARASGASEFKDGLNLSKTATANADGSYTIRMEAFTTGKVTTTTSTTPVDVVLVLDQSGSMAYDFNGNSTSNNTSRRQHAMKQAVNQFISAVADKYGAEKSDHRISIVTFGTNASVLQGWTPVSQVGKTTLQGEITGLPDTPSGATNVGAGMQQAETLMGSGYNYTGSNTTRQKVVVVFTDGVPTTQSDFSTNVANTAIRSAKALKDSGATVYSVGIFNGANPDEMYGASGFDTNSNGTVNSKWVKDTWGLFPGTDFPEADRPPGNRFLNLLSSNFEDAAEVGLKRETKGLGILHYKITYTIARNFNRTSSSYYLTANDSASLSRIFTTISENIGQASIDLSSSTVVKDIVTPYFTMPANTAGVKLYTADYNGMSFGTEQPAGSDVQATIDANTNTVSVTGFDFNKYYVADKQHEGTCGKKLIIEFTVQRKPGFVGGNNVPTNGDTSGVYTDKGVSAGLFDVPKVNVPIIAPKLTGQDCHVYYLGTQPAPGQMCTPYNTAGSDFSFVNVSYTTSGSVDMTQDDSYTVTATVSPKEAAASDSAGAPAQSETATATSHVYVYKPEITYKDSVINLGDTANYRDNSVGTVWKHKGTEAVAADMTGTAPELTFAYEPGADAFTQDTYVQVTVKIGGTNITDAVQFKHKDCSFTGCSFDDTKGQFIVHINVFDLTIVKDDADGSKPIDPKQTFVFKVTNKDTGKTMEVVITGKAQQTIKNLPVGDYTITEDTSWSWKYTPVGGATQELKSDSIQDGAATVTFENENNGTNWLTSLAKAINTWAGGKAQEKTN